MNAGLNEVADRLVLSLGQPVPLPCLFGTIHSQTPRGIVLFFAHPKSFFAPRLMIYDVAQAGSKGRLLGVVRKAVICIVWFLADPKRLFASRLMMYDVGLAGSNAVN